MLLKFGEATVVRQSDIQPIENILADQEILDRFKKFASELKVIAPKAKDFLYFTAVMMHAAEAALLDTNGEIKKDANKNPITSKWEKVGDGVKWVCSDENIKPYKNNNNDIFPEEELIKAHAKWRGRPLCLDHKSSSVDSVRGVVVDTFYDRKFKRVIALCALDKVNYEDLARKVSTGYATSVSMGTAVGRAVCTECQAVARMESDFCDHMRSKSCYGEVNLDLSPIELSIVVNGADPGAKIKHIIAKDLSRAADHISDYVKEKISTGNVSHEELAAIQSDLKAITDRVDKLVEASQDEENEDANETTVGPTQSTKAQMPDIEQTSRQVFAPPTPLVDWNHHIEELRTKVASIQEDLEKITQKEPTMSQKKAYYQGTEEPTPGTPQYEKEDHETIRDTQDKQMVGQGPFPDVGPVDGMYPGYESFGETEEARKRRLQRMAEIRKNQLRREAALEKAKEEIERAKSAYFQGTEDPEKLPYEKEDYEKIRDTQDKQMVGQPPFPDVGPVDGLMGTYKSMQERGAPSDETEYKKMIQRARLRAKFIKAATPNGALDKANSCWQVFAGPNLLLNATVDEITGGKSEVLFDTIATENFGRSMMDKIKSEGFEKAKSLYKSAVPAAQEMGAPGVPADAMPAGAGAAPVGPGAASPDVPPAPEPLEEPKGGGKDEEGHKAVAEEIRDLADELARRADDLVDASSKMDKEQLGDVPPAAEEEFTELPKAASVYQLARMRKALNGKLKNAMSESIENLRGHENELKLAAGIYEDGITNLDEGQKEYLHSLVSDAIVASKSSLNDTKKLMGAFVRYARGTSALVKRARMEAKMRKSADEKKKETKKEKDSPKKEKKQMSPKEVEEVGEGKNRPDPVAASAADSNAAATVKLPSGSPIPADLPPGTKIEVEAANEFDLTTKEGRAQYRAKLAQKAIEYSDMIGRAHPGGGHDLENLDTKPDGDLGRFETIIENKEKHMKVVEMEPQARKQAERIAKLVSEGAIEASEVDGLVAHGVDPEAVKYYKDFWSEAKDSESKQWAADLVKEHEKQKSAEELQKQEVRIKRAYDLAYDMKEAGIINGAQVKGQVEEILGWNDAAYDSTKRLVSKASMRKNAMPQVGLLHSQDVLLPDRSSEQVKVGSDNVNLQSVFEDYFASRPRNSF